MILFDPNKKLKYEFTTGDSHYATIEVLEKIAVFHGETIDYKKLMRDNNLENDWYYSSTLEEVIHIKDMADQFLINAFLKKVRERFVAGNFKGFSCKQFLESLKTEDLEIDRLFKEINMRSEHDND